MLNREQGLDHNSPAHSICLLASHLTTFWSIARVLFIYVTRGALDQFPASGILASFIGEKKKFIPCCWPRTAADEVVHRSQAADFFLWFVELISLEARHLFTFFRRVTCFGPFFFLPCGFYRYQRRTTRTRWWICLWSGSDSGFVAYFYSLRPRMDWSGETFHQAPWAVDYSKSKNL